MAKSKTAEKIVLEVTAEAAPRRRTRAASAPKASTRARIPRKADTFLSSEDLSRTVTRRLLDKLEQLKKDHARGIFPSPAS